jgi:hypothetical protein
MPEQQETEINLGKYLNQSGQESTLESEKVKWRRLR